MNLSRGLTLTFSLLVGCTTAAGEDADGEVVKRSTSAIIGGSHSTTRDAVVLLVSNNGLGRSICTGTLVAPNLVLTARHCLSAISDGRFLCDENGAPTTSYAGGRYLDDGAPGLIGVYAGADAPQRADGFGEPAAYGAEIFHDAAPHICAGDLALLRLDRAVRGAIVAPVRLDRFPATQDHVTVVGFGVTDDNREATSRLERSGVDVLRVGPQTGSTREAPVSKSMFEVGEATCSGDSGGPALDERTGAVVGVVTAGGNGLSGNPQDRAGRCRGETTRNYFTATGAFEGLLREAFLRSGFRPWAEGTPAPMRREAGAPCDDDDMCLAGACIPDDSGRRVCSASCSRRAPGCPVHWTCNVPGEATVGTCRPPTISNASAEVEGPRANACTVAPIDAPCGPATGGIASLVLFAALCARRARRS